jgi:hypothetical protein
MSFLYSHCLHSASCGLPLVYLLALGLRIWNHHLPLFPLSKSQFNVQCSALILDIASTRGARIAPSRFVTRTVRLVDPATPLPALILALYSR